MARGVKVKVSGFKELDKVLGQLPKATGKKTLERVLLRSAAPMQETAEGLAARRDPGASVRTFKVKGGAKKVRRVGTLEHLTQIGTRLTKNQARMKRKEGKDFAEVYVGTRDKIGLLIEEGTKDAAPQPFMRPAWDQHKQEALTSIQQDMGEEIMATAARAARRGARKR